MLTSGVLNQEYIDVKIYEVDNELKAAEYPSNNYRQKFYGVMDQGYLSEIRIQRHKIYPENSMPRELFKFEHIGRYPAIDESLGVKKKKEKDCSHA